MHSDPHEFLTQEQLQKEITVYVNPDPHKFIASKTETRTVTLGQLVSEGYSHPTPIMHVEGAYLLGPDYPELICHY